MTSDTELRGETLASLPIDHDVPPVDFEGGFEAGEQRLFDFLDGAFDLAGFQHPPADELDQVRVVVATGANGLLRLRDESRARTGGSPGHR